MDADAPVAPARRLRDVDDVLSVLAQARHHAESNVGAERVDLLAHSLQCADVLAVDRPADVELQVAGLVHDIGHLLVPDDADGHGRHGASAVRNLFGPRVAGLVELHVTAKRYLVSIDTPYRATLSPVSVRTLELQGGLLDEEGIARFEASPLADDAIVLRRADEAAKVPGRLVANLGAWRPVLQRLAASR